MNEVFTKKLQSQLISKLSLLMSETIKKKIANLFCKNLPNKGLRWKRLKLFKDQLILEQKIKMYAQK